MSDAEWAVLLVREAATLRFHPPVRPTAATEKESAVRDAPRATPGAERTSQ